MSDDACDIPSARAMREVSMGAHSERARTVMSAIKLAIIDAARRGTTTAFVNGPRVPGVVEALKARGYEVEHRRDQRDGDFYEVTW